MDQNQTKAFLRKKQQVKDVSDEIYNTLNQDNGTLNWNNIQQEIQRAAEKYHFEASMEEEIDIIVEEQEINKEDTITNEQFQKFFKALLVQQIPNYESEEDDSNDQKQDDQQKNDNDNKDDNDNDNKDNDNDNKDNDDDNKDKDNDNDNDNKDKDKDNDDDNKDNDNDNKDNDNDNDNDNNNNNSNNNSNNNNNNNNNNKKKDKKDDPAKSKKQEPKKQKQDEQNPSKLSKKEQKEKALQQQQEEKKKINKKLNELKEIKKQLEMQKKTNNAPKIVYSFMNANTDGNLLQEKQKKINLSTINLTSLNKDQTAEKSINLKKVVAKQNIRSGIFKTPEDITKAQSIFKQTPILGMVMARPKNEKYQKLFDTLNNLTDDEFDKCPTRLIFDQLDKQIRKNVQFLIIHIETIKKKYDDQTNNQDNQKNNKTKSNDPDFFLYCWQVKFDERILYQNTFKELDNQSFECLEFLFTTDYIHPLEVLLWKQINNKRNVLVGQFEIIPEEFDQFEDVEEYTEKRRNLRIKRNQKKVLSQENINDKSTILSNRNSKKTKTEQSNYQVEVEFKIIQFAEKVAPQNIYSNTVGSPRSLAERNRRKLVENSKFDPYEWQDDVRNKQIVEDIQNVMMEIEVILTVEDAQGVIEGNEQIMLIIKSGQYGSSEGKSNRTRLRVARVKVSEQVMNLLKTLEEDPNKTVFGNVRTKVIKGRVRKADLEAALQQMQCTAAVLIMDLKDEFGDCPLDFMLANCDFGGILDIVQDLNLGTGEMEAQLDEFSEKLFGNIKQQLTTTLRLQPVYEFLKAAEKIPDIGIVFAQFAAQYQIEKPPFLEYFDINNSNLLVMDNYEHIMLLGKMVKMLKKYVPDSLLCKESEQAYREAKSSLYFLVPVLPKKMNLDKKRDLLTLGINITGIKDAVEFEVEQNIPSKNDPRKLKYKRVQKEPKDEQRCLWNIFHECVRRKRWNDFYRGLEYQPKEQEGNEGQQEGNEGQQGAKKVQPNMIFQKDLNGRSPLHNLFEHAPYEIIMATLIDFSPSKEAEGLPHITADNLMSLVADDNSNILHAIASNFRPQLENQKKLLDKLQEYITQEQLQELLISEIKNSRVTPFIMYLNRMARSEKINPIDYHYFSSIMDVYKSPFKNFNEQINTQDIRPMILLLNHQIEIEKEVDMDLFYHSHVIVSKAMAQLQPSVFEIASEQINWINWYTLNSDKLTHKLDQFAIYNLVRSGKLDIVSNMLKAFEEIVFKDEQNLIKIFPDDFEISNSNETFLQKVNKTIIVNNKNNKQQLEFTEQEFLDKFGKFYKQYPLEILIGIVKTAKESQQKLNASITQQIQQLIKKIIQKEPRVLCTNLYINKGKSVVQELIDIEMDSPYQELPEEQQLLYTNFESKNPLLDAFKAQKKSQQLKQLKICFKNKHSQNLKQIRDLVSYLLKVNKLSSLLNHFAKIESDYDSKFYQKQIGSEILRQWPNYLNNKSNKILQAFKNYPNLVAEFSIKSAYTAAVATKNIKLINNLTVIAWNHQHRIKLPICYSTLPRVHVENSTHYAVNLPLKQFKQLLDDSQDYFSQEDYICMAYALTRNGMVNKLNLIIPKLSNVETLSTLLREALILKSKQDGVALFKNDYNFANSKYLPEFIESYRALRKIVSLPEPTISQQQKQQKQFKDSLFYQILRPYTVPTKRIPMMSNWSLIPEGALQSLLLAASKNFAINSELPRDQTFYRYAVEKQVVRQLYDQMLRKTFLTQNVSCLLSNKQFEESDYGRVIELLINQLTPEAIGLAKEKDPEFEKKLKKTYLLPLSTDKIGIIYQLTNAKKAILKSIDLLIQQHLTMRLTRERMQYLAQITERSLQFIKNQFNPNLLEVMQSDQNRVRRIMRSLDHTLKVNQNQQQKSFAIEVLLIVVNSFQQEHFNGIITGHLNLFNSIAVAMMRGKAETKAAISWMATVLNKNIFYEQVATAKLPSNSKTQQIMKSRIDLEILTIEVEPAERLLVPSNSNANYLLKLAKAKVKPFRKTYELKSKSPLNCKHFDCGDNSIRKVSLLEYLCLQNQDQLVLKHYIKALKPNNITTEQQQRKWLFIACCSGNIQIFESIIAVILQFNYAQIFDLCIKIPIFYQIVLKFNEKSAIQLFRKIFPQKQFTFADAAEQSVQNILKAFGCQNDKDEIQSFVLLIQKKYGELYWEIIEYLKSCSQNSKVYNQILKTIFEFEPKIIQFSFIGDGEDEGEIQVQLNLVEYSLCCGMPDLGMSAKEIKLGRSPFSQQKVQLYETNLYNCGIELLQEEKVLLNSKNQNKLPFYQLFLTIKPFYVSLKQLELRRLAASIALFYLLYNNYQYQNKLFPNLISNLCLLNRQVTGKVIYPFLKYIEDDISDQKNIYDLMYRYHISGFDKIMNYQLSIIQYFELYQKTSNQFWMSTSVQTQYKTLFNVDILKQKLSIINPDSSKENDDEPRLEQIDPDEDKNNEKPFQKLIIERYASLNCIFRQYILLNDPGIIISAQDLLKNTLLSQYDQLFAFIRIGSQMEKLNLIQYMSDIKASDDNEIEHLSRQVVSAELAYCIVDSNYQKYEEVDEDEIVQKCRILQILSDMPQFIDIYCLDRHINRILDNLRLDNFYQLLVKNQQLDKNSNLNKKLKSEKFFIKGLLLFIRQSIQNEQIKYSFSDKDLVSLMEYELPKLYPIQSDKIFRGFEIIKICLSTIYEILKIQNGLISDQNFKSILDIDLVFIAKEKVKKQDYKLIKISEVKQNVQVNNNKDKFDYDQDQQIIEKQFKYEFKIPFAHFENSGVNQVLILDDAINFINNTIRKHQFEQGMLAELIESTKGCSKTVEKRLIKRQEKKEKNSAPEIEEVEAIQETILISIQVKQQLNPTNITIDNYDVLAQNYESLFQFGEFDESEVKDTTDDLEFDKFDLGTSNLRGRGGQLTFEQECSTKSYFDYKHQLQIKVQVLTKASFFETYKRKLQTKFCLDDYVKTMKNWAQYEENEALPEKTLVWPIYVENGQIGYDHYNFPLYTFSRFSAIIHQYYEKKYIINYYSYIESYIHPFMEILESPKLIQQPLEDFIYTALDWPLLNYLLSVINEHIAKKSSNLIFEIQKISKNNAIKATQMTGYDSIFRFGETKYFYHKGFIVVRLSLAFIKGETSTLFPSNKLTIKQKQKTIYQDNSDYIDKVLNLKGLQASLNLFDEEK